MFANGVLAHLPCISHPRYAGLPVYVKATNQVYFGDGEPFSEKVVNALVDAHEQVVYRHRWMANEVLIVEQYPLYAWAGNDRAALRPGTGQPVW